MMARIQFPSPVAAAVLLLFVTTVAEAEIISDLTVGVLDETRALQVKAEQFWAPILAAAEKGKMSDHMQLYADTEKVLAELSSEHAYVKQALTEALAHLKNADDLVLMDAIRSTKLASDELQKPVTASNQGAFSFMTGGQMFNIFRDRLRQFADEGTYSKRLVELVEQRQATILPALQGTAQITGSVLSDCRLASKRSFDALKYDIYSTGRLRGAPKTSESAKAVAYRLVDASGETRHRFMGGITETVSRIASDAEGKHDGAASTVTTASIDVQLKNSVGFGAGLISSSASSEPLYIF